jgi:hypothetical protein
LSRLEDRCKPYAKVILINLTLTAGATFQDSLALLIVFWQKPGALFTRGLKMSPLLLRAKFLTSIVILPDYSYRVLRGIMPSLKKTSIALLLSL